MSDEKKFYERLIAYAQVARDSMDLPGGAPGVISITTLDLVLGMKYAEEHVVQDSGSESAEQLSIALRAEASRLHERTSSSQNMAMKREEIISVAERIADHAVDARALGVRHFNEQARLGQRIANLEFGNNTTAEALRAAIAKLQRVRELCDTPLPFLAEAVVDVLDE